MNAQSFNSFLVSLSNHSFQMVNVRVNITVRNKTHQVESRTLIQNIFYKLFPSCTFKHRTRRNRFTNKLSTLSKNTTTTDCIVTNFTITHIVITWKPYSSSVSLKLSVRTISCKPVQILHFRSLNSIPFFIFTVTNAVHNYKNNRTAATFPIWIFFQSMHSICHLQNSFNNIYLGRSLPYGRSGFSGLRYRSSLLVTRFRSLLRWPLRAPTIPNAFKMYNFFNKYTEFLKVLQ